MSTNYDPMLQGKDEPTEPTLTADERLLLMGLTADKVVRVYSGRPGCGCGCRGTYTTPAENKGQVTRVLNVMRKRIDEVRVNRWTERSGAQLCFALEDDTRYRWVYLRGDVERGGRHQH